MTLASGAEEKAIRNVYGPLGITAIKQLANNMFLITVRDDPGLAAMEKMREGSRHITAVQPNYAYRPAK